jgi:hypothetical protein
MTRARFTSISLAAICGSLLAVLGCAAEPPRTESAAAPEKPTPEVVRLMTEAHGGMAAWQAAPSVCFTDQWSGGKPTRVAVERGTRRVHIEEVGTGARMAWDGEQAWSVEWKGAPPRFTAQLSFYFLNLPWLVHDPGVNLGEPGAGQLWDDPTPYATVMMTFDEGVGDTPEDSFELYVHPETHRLKACRYVMTYRAVLPPGAEKAPAHVVVFDEHDTVGGLVVPTRLTLYGTDRSVIATCSITDWSFDQPFDASKVAMPSGAVMDTTTP